MTLFTLFLPSYFQRSTDSFSEDDAFNICNESINTAPAVLEFPDKMAGEDLDIVVEQCVYDLRVSATQCFSVYLKTQESIICL